MAAESWEWLEYYDAKPCGHVATCKRPSGRDDLRSSRAIAYPNRQSHSSLSSVAASPNPQPPLLPPPSLQRSLGRTMDGEDFSEYEMEAARRLVLNKRRVEESAYMWGGIGLSDTRKQKALEKAEAEARGKLSDTRSTASASMEGRVQCSTCPGDGCKVDHTATHKARAYNGVTCDPVPIDVREDTGSDANWIAPALVRQLQIQVQEVGQDKAHVGFLGVEFTPLGQVSLPLMGTGTKSLYVRCLVAPKDFPYTGIVLGNEFINQSGHPHTLFSQEPAGKSLLMLQKEATASDRATTEQLRIERERRAAELESERRHRMSVQGQVRSGPRSQQQEATQGSRQAT